MVNTQLSTGGYKDTRFTLRGSSAAIAEAIGINKVIDHNVQEKSEDFKKLFLSESKKCKTNMSTFKSCFTQVNECRKQANQDIKKFKACLQ